MIPQDTIENMERMNRMTMDNNPRDPKSSEGFAKGMVYLDLHKGYIGATRGMENTEQHNERWGGGADGI